MSDRTTHSLTSHNQIVWEVSIYRRYFLSPPSPLDKCRDPNTKKGDGGDPEHSQMIPVLHYENINIIQY